SLPKRRDCGPKHEQSNARKSAKHLCLLGCGTPTPCLGLLGFFGWAKHRSRYGVRQGILSPLRGCLAGSFKSSFSSVTDDIRHSLILFTVDEMSVNELFGKLDAFELQQLSVSFHIAIEGHADFPGTCEHFWILDRRFVHEVIRSDRRVALHDF